VTEIRSITSDEVEAYRSGISFGFGADHEDEEGDNERFLSINPLETCIAAFDRGAVVATFGSYDLDISMPAGVGGTETPTVATAGTTHVTVHPTHRRRGILTDMMRLHLDQAVERGQPMAALWASEERIYGRFGYGPAVAGLDINVAAWTTDTAPADRDVTLHPLTADQARPLLPDLYRRWSTNTSGRLARSDTWWEVRYFRRPKRPRGSSGHIRFVVAERAGEPVGYLMFRLEQLDAWSEGRTHIVEMHAADDRARRALWHFVTNIDLYRNVRWWNAPVDEPMIVEADRFRQVQRRIFDTMWVRPLDVAAVLTSRGYEMDGTVVIDVVDGFGPAAGRYRLEALDGNAVCERTTATADVTMDVAVLGRLTLGDRSALTLARAGLIEGSDGSIAALDRLLATARAPHCSEVF
jgi:predicted acetyltransferase